MDLNVVLKYRGREVTTSVKGVEDSVLWDVVDLEQIDQGTLLPCEKPYAGNGVPDIGKVSKQDVENKLLLLKHGDLSFYRDIKSILCHQNGVLRHNFSEKLTRLRDLGKLPRFVCSQVQEQPQPGEINEELVQFLDSVAHTTVLDIELHSDLLHEFSQSPRFEIYYSWRQLALDTSWLAVSFIILEHRLLPWWRNLQDKALVLEYRSEVVNTAPLLANSEYVPGIESQMSHEQFIAENPDLECYSREARNFYYETEPTERALWLAYTSDSVFNQPLAEASVSQVNLDAKACREKRFELLNSIVHDIYEWCKVGQAPRYRLGIDIRTLYSAPPTRRMPEVNVYTRFGKVSRTSELNLYGPGLIYQPGTQTEKQPPVEIINQFYRRVFGIRKAWQENREGLLRSAEILKQSNKPQERREAARRKALAERMGVFLTQKQLHQFRAMIRWLYDRFDVPQEQRKLTEEQYQVAEPRVNDLAEESRRVQAQIELVEHELLVANSYQQLLGLRRQLQRLIGRAKSLYQQQVELAGVAALPPCLKMQGEELEVKELEYLADFLEDDIRRLLDPAHKDFDCDLPTAKLIYGKAGLERRLSNLYTRLAESLQPERTQRLVDMLNQLQERYDLFSTQAQTFLDDIPIHDRLALGIEISDAD